MRWAIVLVLTLTPITAPFPPDTHPAIAFEDPWSYYVVVSENGTYQAAYGTRLRIYVNGNASAIVDGERYHLDEVGWYDFGRLSVGWHTIDVYENGTTLSISLYVMTYTETVEARELSKPATDPVWLKRIYAIVSAIVATVAGVPIGIAIRRRFASKVEEI